MTEEDYKELLILEWRVRKLEDDFELLRKDIDDLLEKWQKK